MLAFANAHAMNMLANSESFFDSLCTADTVLRDGSGMETLFNQLNIPPGLNLNGTDLIPDIVSKFDGRCIALFGTQEPYLESGVDFVEMNLAPKSFYIRADGFHENDVYYLLAVKHRPALIVLGMGMPRQEEVAIALRSRLVHPCLIICGGAIIDFWGGRTSRAPLWMRRNGMEWLFRLQLEPRRLFKRYVIGNLVFLTRTLIFSAFNRRLSRQILKRQA
ncbi:N-acetylmannosaminyltransferase [Polaromonas sp. CG9_12]|nr:N-acetylmannosaminyltransferase [Polaromonas sp. CG9_12]